jgi:hypothetical protein
MKYTYYKYKYRIKKDVFIYYLKVYSFGCFLQSTKSIYESYHGDKEKLFFSYSNVTPVNILSKKKKQIITKREWYEAIRKVLISNHLKASYIRNNKLN